MVDAASNFLEAAGGHLSWVVGLGAVAEFSKETRCHGVLLDHEVHSPLSSRWRLGRGGWGHPLAPPSMVKVAARHPVRSVETRRRCQRLQLSLHRLPRPLVELALRVEYSFLSRSERATILARLA